MRLLGSGGVVVAALAGVALLPGAVVGRATVTPTSFPSCGTYWNRNTPVSQAERRANTCIVRAARDGRRARLVAALTTVEGDPIVNYVFVRGQGDVLVVIDSRRDAFGSRRWDRFRCMSLALATGRLVWSGCRSVGTGKPAWLEPIRLRG